MFSQQAGCTDSYASNYSSNADFDDGSCTYASYGDYFMDFDGSGDVINIPDSDGLDLNDKGTIMFWMKPKTINQPGNAGLVVKSHNGNYGGNVYGISYYVVWRQNDGKLQGYISDGNSSNTVAYQNLEHLADGDWHHISFTWDGSELRLYVDSQLKSTAAQTISGAFNSGYNLKIGGDAYGYDGGTSDHFNGWIDDVWILAYHIYGDDYPDNGNWANVPAHIMQYKNIPTNWGIYTGGYVRGHWSFNDIDSSSVAIDYTGNQNHGTINGSEYSEYIFCDQHSDCESNQFCYSQGYCVDFYSEFCRDNLCDIGDGDCDGNDVEESGGEFGCMEGLGCGSQNCDFGGNYSWLGCCCLPGTEGCCLIDNCGVCDFDSANDCITDCNNDWGGSAYLDNCNNCVGGNTGNLACEKDCNDEWGGSAVEDQCGVCDGDNSSCADCAGVPNGNSEIDECGICGGSDNNGDGECNCISTSDCSHLGNYFCYSNGDGAAYCAAYDWEFCATNECYVGDGDCDGGYTNSQGECSGNLVCGGRDNCDIDFINGSTLGCCCEPDTEFCCSTDNCGVCDDDPSNDCTQDCNNDWGGSAYFDNCNNCVGGNTGESACVQDCNNDWGGSAVEDQCGVCNGDNSSCSDCAGVPNGDAEFDVCNICNGENILVKAKSTIAAGEGHALVLSNDGTVEAWGMYSQGQIDVPDDLLNVVEVSSSGSNSLVLLADGTVRAWGYGIDNVPSDLANVVQIAGGGVHALALLSDQTVRGWGTSQTFGPFDIPNDLANVIQISAGYLYSLALLEDGTVQGWGYNQTNQTDIPEDLSNVMQISAGRYHSLALLEDGTVRAWGGTNDDGEIDVPDNLSDVIQVSAGNKFSLALSSNGDITAWGNQVSIGNIPSNVPNVIQISAGHNFSMILTSDGTISAYGGSNSHGELDIPENLIASVSLDSFSGPDTDCSGVCFGNAVLDNCGNCNGDCDGTGLCEEEDCAGICGGNTPVDDCAVCNGDNYFIDGRNTIAAENVYTLAVSIDGTVSDWGLNSGDIPEDLFNVVEVSAGWQHRLALLEDGTVRVWGSSYFYFDEDEVPDDVINVIQVSAGNHHSLALLQDGSVRAWGNNQYGQSTVPEDLPTVLQVSAGNAYSSVLLGDGTVRSWGSNFYAQLDIPEDLSNVIQISSDHNHTLALLNDGTVRGWGDNSSGQIDIPEDLSNVIKVSAGGNHSLALLADGTVRAWGNSDIVDNIPENLNNIVHIVSGYTHAVFLSSDGTISAIGANTYGEVDIPLEFVADVNTDYFTGDNIDCNSDCFGGAIIDECGICSGGNTGIAINGNLDCTGLCGGTAYLDNCNQCILEQEVSDCIQDCNGNWGGLDNIPSTGDEASLDLCGVCDGNNECDNYNYCAGDTILDVDQNKTFDVCYGECGCEDWKLSDYSGDIIFIDMSATWCSPCYSSIGFIDGLEEYWKDKNSNVKFVTALTDINNPYSCQQWGNSGIANAPLIIEDIEGQFYDWFHDANGQYPNYVIIDHNMEVVAKPSSVTSNINDTSCDGADYMEGLDSDCINTMIIDLLSECGDACEYNDGYCSDINACNYQDSAACIYPNENYNCCGECDVEVDCLGICGGDATDDDCIQVSGGCPTCTIVCDPDDTDCEGDFTSIQAAIDFASEGDTVLVEKGRYEENLLIQKSITLISRGAFDDLSDWMVYNDGYEVANHNIANTILDGSFNSSQNGLGSVITINSPPNSECITPIIKGFTITGGTGNAVLFIDQETGESYAETQGGGFYSNNASPTFNYNAFLNNGTMMNAMAVDLGGGGVVTSGAELDPPIPNWGVEDCTETTRGWFNMISNAWGDNDASYGNSLATRNFEDDVDMSYSYFDVYNCPDDEVTGVWVDVEEGTQVDFSYGVGDLCSIKEDVWVSPDGNDENNLGTSVSEAFLTIERALEMIAPEDDDPITINLTEGRFAPSTTFESFSIKMISNVNLIGQGQSVTILDAESDGLYIRDRVIELKSCVNNIISDLMIMGGESTYAGNSEGAGVYIYYSNPTIQNITITENHATRGGGVYSYFSDPQLINVSVTSNTAYSDAGGIYLNYSNPIINNTLISNNISQEDLGGGIYMYSSNPLIVNSSILGNKATGGAGIFVNTYSDPQFTNVIINSNEATDENITSQYNLCAQNPDYQGCFQGGGILFARDRLERDHNEINLTNVTITENIAVKGAGIYIGWGAQTLEITNSIIWNNATESIHLEAILVTEDIEDYFPLITFSNIEGDTTWYGNGNINIDPILNSDFTLGSGSPCINTGSPNLWYQNLGNDYSDMGVTGGSLIVPNFIEYEFAAVGDIPLEVTFNLFNARESQITIGAISFEGTMFSSPTEFPVEILPGQSRDIQIVADPEYLGYFTDQMMLYSPQLPNGIFIPFSVNSVNGLVLQGELSGNLASGDYLISGDISVPIDKELIINPGTKFLFNGGYKFTINGTLVAQGTQSDSIIFDNYNNYHYPDCFETDCYDQMTYNLWWSDYPKYINPCSSVDSNIDCSICEDEGACDVLGIVEKWHGVRLNNVTNETVFEYVRISGAGSIGKNGLKLTSSSPILNHIDISNNGHFFSTFGGGIIIIESNPKISNANIYSNQACYGGGLYFDSNSAPIELNDVIIDNNFGAEYGGGVYLGGKTDLIMNNIIISNNWTSNVSSYGGGAYFSYTSYNSTSNSTGTHLKNVVFYNNSASYGGGVYINYIDPFMNNVTFIGNESLNNGGAIYSNRGYSTFNNVTISGNSSLDPGSAGAIYVAHCSGNNFNLSSNNSFKNSIIWDNGLNPIQYDSEGIGWNIICYDSDIEITYSNIDVETPWSSDVGNISQNPMFNSDYTLQAGSPCIDEGLADFDGDGVDDMHYVGLAPDMGAFEYGCNANTYDECGVCEGDNSTCLDCAGIINGEALEEIFWPDLDGDGLGAGTPSILCNGLNLDGWTTNNSDLDDYCTSNSYDDCGVCDDEGIACIQGCTDTSAYNHNTDAGVDDGSCIYYGDINMDGSINVSDAVLLIDHIVFGTVIDSDQIALSDLNDDGLLNVVDVVMIIDLILGTDLSRGIATTRTTLYYGNGDFKYEADGTIAGIQLDVIGDYDVTDIHLPSGWELSHNDNIIMLYSLDGATLEDKLLFSYSGDFFIKSAIVADWHGSEVAVESKAIPKAFNLSPAYPNPFNPIANLKFALPEASDVSIVIYDMQGREVTTLKNDVMDAGYHTIRWNATHHASGIYFVQMNAGEYFKSQKLMLIK